MTTQAYRFAFYRWLLTPFKSNGHLTSVQIRYNERHCGTHQVIERALGLLKGRWRRLKCLEMEAVEGIPFAVFAGCVLHNFCLLADEGDIEQFLDDDSHGDDSDSDDQPDQPLPQALAKRNMMVQYLSSI